MKVKVISLLQPWATLLFTPSITEPARAAKQWETRSWKPSKEMLRYLQNNWLYIHCSAAWRKDQQTLIGSRPFYQYCKNIDLPKGAIIGRVRIGDILTTEMWKDRYAGSLSGMNVLKTVCEEYHFGDYSPNRYAWEVKQYELLAVPIPTKGALSIWEYDMPEPYGLSGPGAHASFPHPPSVETIKAVQMMMDLAYTNCK